MAMNPLKEIKVIAQMASQTQRILVTMLPLLFTSENTSPPCFVVSEVRLRKHIVMDALVRRQGLANLTG